jgi:hypothetical protein
MELVWDEVGRQMLHISHQGIVFNWKIQWIDLIELVDSSREVLVIL